MTRVELGEHEPGIAHANHFGEDGHDHAIRCIEERIRGFVEWEAEIHQDPREDAP